ncbi:hypothetical protein HPP92_003766 [Vanilla planifolia]|uniref:MADS-box domain-containing protein n=1 Tax=Vanilla planifolia TaxID=51239 RepID=A0A835VJ96_VANPL|nr:hypothetical protein HPP92_003766 [Vanilla planifolia]
MGRAKLETKYREDRRARLTTYLNRLKGAKKKARETSIVCGVDILMVSDSPDLNATNCWPEDPASFRSIADNYLCRRWRKLGPFLPSLALPSFHEELTALEAKLEEARERICFLGSVASEELSDSVPTVDEFDLEFPTLANSISIAETAFNSTRSINSSLCDDSYFDSIFMDDDLVSSVVPLVSIFSDDADHQLW